MPQVFQTNYYHRTAKILDILFEGTYEECEKFFWNKLEEERVRLKKNEHYVRTYPATHNSLEAVWHNDRLVLQNWEADIVSVHAPERKLKDCDGL